MNTDRIRKVAEAIAAHPDQFDYGHWVSWPAPQRHDREVDASHRLDAVLRLTECHTTGCVAGWAALVATKDPSFNTGDYADNTPLWEVATDYLDLTVAQADALWVGSMFDDGINTRPGEVAHYLLALADDEPWAVEVMDECTSYDLLAY